MTIATRSSAGSAVEPFGSPVVSSLDVRQPPSIPTRGVSRMSKKVALVGHCGPDSSYLRIAVSRAAGQAKVLSADDSRSLQRVLDDGVDLLLLNRQLDFGFDEEEGVEVIRKLRAQYPQV